MPKLTSSSSQVLPAYKRPFDETEFRGYFVWSDELSESLGPHIYHGCHEDELNEALDAQQLTLRSEWKLRLPQGNLWPVPGVWVGLNYYASGNYYGPLLIELPIELLDGCQFMVFHRIDRGRDRYFFVQHESRIPVYTFKEKGKKRKLWRNVNATHYFDKVRTQIIRKPGAIYDIVLTHPIDLTDYKVKAVSHPWCASKKCNCSTAKTNDATLLNIARHQARHAVLRSDELQACLERFPCLEGQDITLKRRKPRRFRSGVA